MEMYELVIEFNPWNSNVDEFWVTFQNISSM
jgi:hypothetical protein